MENKKKNNRRSSPETYAFLDIEERNFRRFESSIAQKDKYRKWKMRCGDLQVEVEKLQVDLAEAQVLRDYYKQQTKEKNATIISLQRQN